ncbi:hypothetical protein [Phenylobacterium sp.]|uniref:hypothetical protein n=1 Tax=Phenylobacterium sp. TaxID=1871053 RepID=UPI00272F11FF|nr:hypothetical protein [Phenylobacterium sp.]MDP1618986.1 hypothetical protein [Phenylobacterium sp.]MDP1988152.1 hypothetical protein [Phenylobacterium sp.]
MWTVPQPVLRLVALALLGVAGIAFAMGVIGAEPRGGRLPGEAPSSGDAVAPVVATDARALDENNRDIAARDAAIENEATEAAATVAAAEPTVETAAADPQIPALQVPDEPVAPRPPPAKAPAPKAPPTPAPSGDAIGDLVDGLTPSELPPF